MRPRFQWHADESILHLCDLRLYAVHRNAPARIIRNRRHQHAACGRHRTGKHRIRVRRELPGFLGKLFLHLLQRPVVKAIYVRRQALSFCLAPQRHRIAGLQIAELQQEAAVHIVEVLLRIAVACAYLLHRGIAHVRIILSGLRRRKAVAGIVELTEHTHQHRIALQCLAETVLGQCRRPGMGVPSIQRTLRQHIAERQCKIRTVHAGISGAADKAESPFPGRRRLLGVNIIFYRHQHVHQRRGTGDGVGIGRGLHPHQPEEIRAVGIGRRRKEGYAREIHPGTIVLCFPCYFFKAIKIRILGLHGTHQLFDVCIVTGIGGARCGRHGSHRHIETRFH